MLALATSERGKLEIVVEELVRLTKGAICPHFPPPCKVEYYYNKWPFVCKALGSGVAVYARPFDVAFVAGYHLTNYLSFFPCRPLY